MLKLLQEDVMIYSTKYFSEVNEYTTTLFVVIQRFSNCFSYILIKKWVVEYPGLKSNWLE